MLARMIESMSLELLSSPSPTLGSIMASGTIVNLESKLMESLVTSTCLVSQPVHAYDCVRRRRRYSNAFRNQLGKTSQ